MITILSHALKHFTVHIFFHALPPYAIPYALPPATENADSVKSIRAFESFPFTFARRGIASFTTFRQSAVSIILTRLTDFVVKRMCLPWELDNPTLRHYDIAGSAYESPSGRFTDRYRRTRYDKSRLRFGRRTDQTKSNYPLSLVSGKSYTTCGAGRSREKREPFNGLVSSNKLNRGRIVRRAISTAIQEREGPDERTGEVSSWPETSLIHNPSWCSP